MNRCTHINPDASRHIRCLLVSGHVGPCQHHTPVGTVEVTRTMNNDDNAKMHDPNAKMHDPMVHRPAHYNLNDMGIEAVDAIRAALGEEGFRAYCRGNVIKYSWRAENKGNVKQDMAKAAWYARLAAGDDPRNDPVDIDKLKDLARRCRHQ